MIWLATVVLLIVLTFGGVLLVGAPYVPTLRHQQAEALQLLGLKPGQTMVELGSGDGRVLKAAAKQGIRSIGYELNPLLVLYSRLATFRYRQLVEVRYANFWQTTLPPCDGIYVFLLDKYMPKLYKKITQEISKPVKVVSFAFKFPQKKHITEKSGLYLYLFDNKNKPQRDEITTPGDRSG